MRQMIRRINGKLIAPILRATGKRFGKIHRQQNDAIYRWIDTVGANTRADGF